MNEAWHRHRALACGNRGGSRHKPSRYAARACRTCRNPAGRKLPRPQHRQRSARTGCRAFARANSPRAPQRYDRRANRRHIAMAAPPAPAPPRGEARAAGEDAEAPPAATRRPRTPGAGVCRQTSAHCRNSVRRRYVLLEPFRSRRSTDVRLHRARIKNRCVSAGCVNRRRIYAAVSAATAAAPHMCLI